jgi:hypothetical protein
MPTNLLIRPTRSVHRPRMEPVGIDERVLDPSALTA